MNWFHQEAPKSKPLLPDGAVPTMAMGAYVQAALMDEDLNPDLQILEQQRRLKADAREAKAARQLAKGNLAACTGVCLYRVCESVV